MICLRGENARTAKSINAYHVGVVGMILCFGWSPPPPKLSLFPILLTKMVKFSMPNSIPLDISLSPRLILNFVIHIKICHCFNKYLIGYIALPYSQLGQIRPLSMIVFYSTGLNTVIPNILKVITNIFKMSRTLCLFSYGWCLLSFVWL